MDSQPGFNDHVYTKKHSIVNSIQKISALKDDNMEERDCISTGTV